MRSVIISNILLFFFAINNIVAQNPADYTLEELDTFCNRFYEQDKYDSLLIYSKVAVEKAKQEYGEQDTVYANMLIYLAEGYFKLDMNKSIECEKIAIDIFKQYIQQDKAPFSYLNTTLSLALNYHNISDFQKAISTLLEIEPLVIKFYSNNELYIIFLEYLASNYRGLGENDKAEIIIRQAINLTVELEGKSSAAYAAAVRELATLYLATNRYLEAIDLYQNTIIPLEQEYGDSSQLNLAAYLSGLGVAYLNIGRYELAEDLFLQIRDIYAKYYRKDHPYYLSILNNLGAVYFKMEHYEGAELIFKEVANSRKEKSGKNSLHYADMLAKLATVHEKKKEYKKSVKIHLEIQSIYEKNGAKDRKEYLRILNALATSYKHLGEKQKSKNIFLQVLKKHLLQTKGKKDLIYATYLNDFGTLYMENKEYNKSEEIFLESIETLRNSLNNKSPVAIVVQSNLGDLYFNTQDYAKSWKAYEKAIRINSNMDISSVITTRWADSLSVAKFRSLEKMNSNLNSIYKLLEIEEKEGYKEKQAIVADLSIKLLKKYKDRFTGNKDKLGAVDKSVNWSLKYLSLLDKENEIADGFRVAEQSKAILLTDATQTKQAYTFGDLPDSIITEEKSFYKEKSTLEAKILENDEVANKDSLRIRLNELNIDLKKFKEKIDKKYPKYRKLKYAQVDNSIANIQKELADNSALIEYVEGDSSIHIFYIDKEQSKWVEQLITKEEFKAKVEELRLALTDYGLLIDKPKVSYRKYTEAAYWFYQQLLEPVLSINDKITHLTIIPDGQLGNLPFEAFLLERAPQDIFRYENLHYLINNYTINYNYSASLLQQNKKNNQRLKNNNKLLAIAANYELRPSKGTAYHSYYSGTRDALIPLPGAIKEIQVLEQEYEGYFLFDSLASEKTFKSVAADYSIIHLAMHGLLDNKNSILSSLAFTDTKDSLENDFLQAYEISKLELNADLVVLSACETGYGKFERGNGVASLARSFMYAGTPALVVSLWSVNDASTSFIMQEFYNNLSQGKNKAEALSEAKFQYIAATEGKLGHPAFWSPFVLIGNYDAIEIERKSSFGWQWLVGGGFFLLLLIVGIRMKKSR